MDWIEWFFQDKRWAVIVIIMIVGVVIAYLQLKKMREKKEEGKKETSGVNIGDGAKISGSNIGGRDNVIKGIDDKY